eukprot:m.125027 g.125027  ORF g.125027 m.125027 type:complete len:77 (-) comp52197_c0_seq1:57-287(-)
MLHFDLEPWMLSFISCLDAQEATVVHLPRETLHPFSTVIVSGGIGGVLWLVACRRVVSSLVIASRQLLSAVRTTTQ